MNWAAFDLNLLVVFDAVMQERSVTRAGRKIGLSQPAMSHALNRLRYMLKDQLFIRTPEGMVPTARAEQLAEPLRRTLDDMRRALEPETFVPKEADRRFTIAVNNYAAIVVSPALLAAVSTAAPRVRLELPPSGTLDVEGLLDRRELDLAIGYFSDPGERFALATLLEDRLVLVMRRGHPAAGRKLTPSSFASLPRLAISSAPDFNTFVEAWLGREKLRSRTVHAAPYLATARILAASDLVAILGERIAQVLVSSAGFSVAELPRQSPRTVLKMLWHRRLDRQAADVWLRGVVADVCKDL